MSALDRALETLEGNLEEIRSTIRSRTDLIDGVAAISGVVQQHLAALPDERRRFAAALQARRTSSDSLNRGLFLTTFSAFEGFVKSMVSALIQKKLDGVGKFSELPETFRQNYIVRASQVLSNFSSGAVKGIPYNFRNLQRSIAVCFADSTKPMLDGDVFTILMGNPTWTRLTDVLESIGIATPFDQAFGSSTAIHAWGGRGSWKSKLTEAEKKLNELMAKRNAIVHAAQPTTIVEQDVIDACDFFEAIARALIAEMPRRV
jgi:hypothetical protein